MAHDPVRGQVLLHGGSLHVDTFVLESGRWRDASQAAEGPREQGVAYFDAASERVTILNDRSRGFPGEDWWVWTMRKFG